MAEHKMISVVMATYNGGKFLQPQIESIVNQTRPPDEIIVVDDGSSDDTLEIVKTSSGNCHVKLFKNDWNLGPVKNFERALSISTGELIFFADQDDVWSLDKIETFLREKPESHFVYSDAYIIGEKDKVVHESEIKDYHKKKPLEGNPFFHLFFSVLVSGHNLMISRELADKVLPFPEFIMYDKWISLVASCCYRIDFIDSKLCYHRIHSSNFVNNRGSDNKSIFRKHRFFERNTKLGKIIDELVGRGLRSEEIELLQEHYSNFDDTVFNFRLFFYLWHKCPYFLQDKSLFFKIDRLIKFSKAGKGYWIPSIRF